MMTRVTTAWCLKRLGLSCALALFLVLAAAAQDAPSLDHNVPPPGSPPGQGLDLVVTWKTLVPNILQDQKRIYTSPLQLAHGKAWLPMLSVVGVTAGLVALDPTDTPYFRRTNSLRDFNNVFSGTNMTLGTIAPPVALYLVGLARHDEYTQSTAFLAGESLADCQILATLMKGATRRLRPSDIPPDGDFTHTWFRGGTLSSMGGAGSFPSGHTIAAFAVATVIARRYPNHRWVPFVSYGIASLVGFSRITNQAHFPSDVFMGAALGYAVSRFVVLHRY